MADRQLVTTAGAQLEVFLQRSERGEVAVCAAHPADRFDAGTASLLAELTGAGVACVNPVSNTDDSETTVHLAVPNLEEMVDRIEAARRHLGVDRWIFWGMSGGGWLAQLYAHRHPDALRGVVIESACLCFRERLADPTCVLSPHFPAWQEPLGAAGLLSTTSRIAPPPKGDIEWFPLDGVGEVVRRRDGEALLVSPGDPPSPRLRRVMPHLLGHDAWPWIGTVRVPALVLAGNEDPVVPLHHARAIHEALPDSTFVVIEGAGHVPTAQRRPEVAAAFRRFVAELDAGWESAS